LPLLEKKKRETNNKTKALKKPQKPQTQTKTTHPKNFPLLNQNTQAQISQHHQNNFLSQNTNEMDTQIKSTTGVQV
jgi:hypothetical protein